MMKRKKIRLVELLSLYDTKENNVSCVVGYYETNHTVSRYFKRVTDVEDESICLLNRQVKCFYIRNNVLLIEVD